MLEAVRKGHITYVFLDSRRYGETAKAIGRFILQDLKTVSARIDAKAPEAERIPFTVIIDDFSTPFPERFRTAVPIGMRVLSYLSLSPQRFRIVSHLQPGETKDPSDRSTGSPRIGLFKTSAE